MNEILPSLLLIYIICQIILFYHVGKQIFDNNKDITSIYEEINEFKMGVDND